MVLVTFRFVMFPGDLKDKPTFPARLQVCPRIGEEIQFSQPIDNLDITNRNHVVKNVIHPIQTKDSYTPCAAIVEIVPVGGR